MKTLLIFLSLTIQIYSQDYKIGWQPVENAEYYKIYIWQGLDYEDCPLIDSLNYITPDIELLEVDSTTSLEFTYPIVFNGELLRAAVVAFNSVDTSLMSVGNFHQKPFPLRKPVIIQDEILIYDKWWSGIIDSNYLYNLPNGNLPRRENGTFLYLKVDKNNNIIVRNTYRLK